LDYEFLEGLFWALLSIITPFVEEYRLYAFLLTVGLLIILFLKNY